MISINTGIYLRNGTIHYDAKASPKWVALFLWNQEYYADMRKNRLPGHLEIKKCGSHKNPQKSVKKGLPIVKKCDRLHLQ